MVECRGTSETKRTVIIMNTTMPSNPRPARKISYKEQQSVDEILQLVQDQTRKISLSGADYRTQKRLERSASQIDDDSDFFDDSSCGTASSDISSSPPTTQETMLSHVSWETRHRSHSNGDTIGKRSLPPLDPINCKATPPRPPTRLMMHESLDNETSVKRVRPMSARGQRTLTNGRTRGLTT